MMKLNSVVNIYDKFTASLFAKVRYFCPNMREGGYVPCSLHRLDA